MPPNESLPEAPSADPVVDERERTRYKVYKAVDQVAEFGGDASWVLGRGVRGIGDLFRRGYQGIMKENPYKDAA